MRLLTGVVSTIQAGEFVPACRSRRRTPKHLFGLIEAMDGLEHYLHNAGLPETSRTKVVSPLELIQEIDRWLSS